MQTGSDKPNANEERHGLPPGQGDHGRGEDTPSVQLSETAKELEELLRATNGEADPEPDDKHSLDKIAEDYRFLKRHTKKLRLRATERKIALQQSQREAGRHKKRYQFKKGWLSRKAALDPAIIKAAIDSDPEIKKLREYNAINPGERKAKLKKAMIAKEEPALKRKIEEIQAKIRPVVQQLTRLDADMRRAIQAHANLIYQANHIHPPTEYDMNRRIKERSRKISQRLMQQKLDHDQWDLRQRHGYWEPARKRAREYQAQLAREGRKKQQLKKEQKQHANHQERE